MDTSDATVRADEITRGVLSPSIGFNARSRRVVNDDAKNTINAE